ncbi:hypothetical protein MYMAC_006870 [Corallococcus macrosporus DSM 14697]|uniref:Uncharacterized protein n=1 Tax=Corallococcus macrosporus DSM 14697 TaxID=1189310 RepID=A0A286NVL7_9BACT|nr:hypothetical protein MYMAC_006870 [Corallococcus macrosporus DSM 14697]
MTFLERRLISLSRVSRPRSYTPGLLTTCRPARWTSWASPNSSAFWWRLGSFGATTERRARRASFGCRKMGDLRRSASIGTCTGCGLIAKSRRGEGVPAMGMVHRSCCFRGTHVSVGAHWGNRNEVQRGLVLSLFTSMAASARGSSLTAAMRPPDAPAGRRHPTRRVALLSHLAAHRGPERPLPAASGVPGWTTAARVAEPERRSVSVAAWGSASSHDSSPCWRSWSFPRWRRRKVP